MQETEDATPLVIPETRAIAIQRPAGYPLPSYAQTEGADREEPQIREYLRAVRKHIWLIIAIVFTVTALATLNAAQKPDIFQAQARVQVDLESNPAAGAGKSSTVVISQANDPSYFNTQIQNLSSMGMLRRVAKTLDLEHNEAFLRPDNEAKLSTWDSLRKMVGFKKNASVDPVNEQPFELPLTSKVAPASSQDDLVEVKRLGPIVRALRLGMKINHVKENMGSSSATDTRLIDISFTHPDPRIAAKIVNAVASTFVLSNLEKKTETNQSAGVYLQKRVAELQRDIREAEERLVNYANNHQILSLDGTQNIVVERLGGLNRQLLEAENERKMAEAAYRAALSPGAAAALAASDAKQADELQGKLGALRERRNQLLVDSTEEWPEVKQVTEQIATLEKQLSELRTGGKEIVTKNLETRYRQAADRENALRTAFNQQKGETVTQNEAAINYKIIQQEIDQNKQLLDGLLQKYKENDVVTHDTPNNISVVDYAVIPDIPTGPQRLRSILIAFFLSLAAAISLAILLEYLNDSIRSTDDVSRWVHLPSIGVIPAVGMLAKRRFSLPGLALERRGSGTSPELLIDVEDKSLLAEAYRHLRTSVLLSSAGHPPRTLLVTSSVPCEGKTTTVVNTALSLAQTGASVIVVDGDMRCPRLHSIFGLQNKQGLSSILSSDKTETEILNLASQHQVNGITVLTSGAIPPNPAELIGSEQMRRLIDILSKSFTHVLIDSPPVGSFTDGVLASTLVDGVLLVVRSGRTSRNIVRRTRQLLQDVGAKVFGVVLNNVNLREHDYFYYRRYYSDHHTPEAEVDQIA
jgi:succinoglycan biosynthesis transport protein ExoP